MTKLPTVEGKNVFEFATTVTGTLTRGDKVCRGPDWHYQEHWTKIGIVIAHQEANKVTVCWNNINGQYYRYNWEDESGYELELVQ